MDINDRIISLMNELKISQVEFARITGIKQSSISRIKNREYEPSSSAIVKICNSYNVNANWLLTGKGRMFNSEEKEKLDFKKLIPIIEYLAKIYDDDYEKVLSLLQDLESKE